MKESSMLCTSPFAKAAEPGGCYGLCGNTLEEVVDFVEATCAVVMEGTCYSEDIVFDLDGGKIK
jgi:hypothetical protein